MAETMIDRVARTLRDEIASPSGDSEWVLDEGFRSAEYFADIARTIVAAMREPTGEMIDAGYGDTKGDPDHSGCSDNPLPDDSWPRMIDAVIGEQS